MYFTSCVNCDRSDDAKEFVFDAPENYERGGTVRSILKTELQNNEKAYGWSKPDGK